MNIIFIAPPAAGKGTKSASLVNDFGYAHISTGDLLRNEIKSGSELGKEIKKVIEAGELVNDELITKLLKHGLASHKEDNVVLDGYPRNIDQAIMLTSIFEELDIKDYKVIYLTVSRETAAKRALGRLICEDCGATYNTYFESYKSKVPNICDKCHGTLVNRSDDTFETFNRRFENFVKVTSPMLEYYRELNKLYTVDTDGEIDNSFNEIKEIVGIN